LEAGLAHDRPAVEEGSSLKLEEYQQLM